MPCRASLCGTKMRHKVLKMRNHQQTVDMHPCMHAWTLDVQEAVLLMEGPSWMLSLKRASGRTCRFVIIYVKFVTLMISFIPCVSYCLEIC